MWGYRTCKVLKVGRPVVAKLAAELVKPGRAPVLVPESRNGVLNAKVERLLHQFQHPAEIHFNDLLLPDDDEHVRRDVETHMGRDAKTATAISAKAELTWDVKHQMHRDKLRTMRL